MQQASILRKGKQPSHIAVTEEAGKVRAQLPCGSLVILRGYVLPEREYHARMLQKQCRRYGWKLLIAGDPALAVKIRADGLHMPEGLAFRLSVWRKRKPGWVMTMAAHSTVVLYKARCFGVDAVLYSPVFPTDSHPGAPALGVVRFNNAIRNSPVPAYALGGVNARTLPRLKGTQAAGVAAKGLFAAPLPPDVRYRLFGAGWRR